MLMEKRSNSCAAVENDETEFLFFCDPDENVRTVFVDIFLV